MYMSNARNNLHSKTRGYKLIRQKRYLSFSNLFVSMSIVKVMQYYNNKKISLGCWISLFQNSNTENMYRVAQAREWFEKETFAQLWCC